MKYIDPRKDVAQESIKTESNLFDRSGEEVINEKEKSYAKVVTTIIENRDPTNTYYIKTYQNSPFDPNGLYGHREQYLETKFNKVSQNTFDYYMMFLKTRNSLYMTRAQRSFIND
tara:strand:- start:223 stop:567 length:345 start_codon:yes stop_codon:yes gene_type:complete